MIHNADVEQTLTCVECGAAFNKRPKARNQKFCSHKCRLIQWTRINRDKHNASVRKYRANRYAREGAWRDEGPKAKALKAWMVELKSNPCADCGGTFEACCMDFDHHGSDKAYNIGSMFAHHYSRELIKVELDKCDLVCSNCHRIRTRNRRTGSGKHRRKD